MAKTRRKGHEVRISSLTYNDLRFYIQDNHLTYVRQGYSHCAANVLPIHKRELKKFAHALLRLVEKKEEDFYLLSDGRVRYRIEQ